MSLFMINRVESAFVRSRRLLSIISKAKSTRVGCSVIFVGGVLAARMAHEVAHCEGIVEEDQGSASRISRGPARKSLNGLGGGGSSNYSDKNDPMKMFLDKYAGFLQNLGFSGVMGICSGVALKKATRAAAATVGLVFVGLQALNYMGYITIDYSRVQKDAQKLVDVNGDGKVDSKDLYSLWDKVKDVLSYQLPQAGSFSTGFALGFYYF